MLGNDWECPEMTGKSQKWWKWPRMTGNDREMTGNYWKWSGNDWECPEMTGFGREMTRNVWEWPGNSWEWQGYHTSPTNFMRGI